MWYIGAAAAAAAGCVDQVSQSQSEERVKEVAAML